MSLMFRVHSEFHLHDGRLFEDGDGEIRGMPGRASHAQSELHMTFLVASQKQE